MPKVLFIGDLNVDVMMGGMESLPLVDREVACQSYDVLMGASTVLCACAYASLGGDGSFAALAGCDEYGDFVVRGLQEFGLNTTLVRRTDQVRTGVTVNLIYRNTRTQVTYPGTIAAFSGEGLDESVLRQFGHIHFGGVYLQHAFRPRIAELLEVARRLGVTSSLDPQWDGTERWEHMDEWLPRLTWFFVNEDEARSLTHTATAEEALVALAGRTRCPLVKTGERGALAYVGGEVKRIPSHVVQVVDTTGAGDSFDAGFLYATLVKQWEVAEAAAFGNAVAARSCTFVGGVAARSSFGDIQKFIGTNPVRPA